MDIFVHYNQHQECSAPSNMDYQRSRCRCKCVNKSPYNMDPHPVTNQYATSTRTCHINNYPLATGFFTRAPTHTSICHINAHVPHQHINNGADDLGTSRPFPHSSMSTPPLLPPASSPPPLLPSSPPPPPPHPSMSSSRASSPLPCPPSTGSSALSFRSLLAQKKKISASSPLPSLLLPQSPRAKNLGTFRPSFPAAPSSRVVFQCSPPPCLS